MSTCPVKIDGERADYQFRGVCVSMVEKIFGRDWFFSLELKSEGVMDDDSGDSEEDEGKKRLIKTRLT